MSHNFLEQDEASETRAQSQAKILSCISILANILSESVEPKTFIGEKSEEKIDPQHFELPD